MRVNFDENHCFWHSDCLIGRHSSPMKEIEDKGDKTLMECCGCGEKGFYPHGRKGVIEINSGE